MYIYILYIYNTFIYEPGPWSATPPNGMVPPHSTSQTFHLHAICSIWKAPPPICTLFTAFGRHPSVCTLSVAFESHNLVTGPCLAVDV